MMASRMAIRALVAAAFAAIGNIGEVPGCIVLLGLGIMALFVQHRSSAADGASLPELSQFIPWGICILLYAGFVVLLAPLASMPAVFIALLILSPFFGTLVLMVSSALIRLTNRRS